jgi:hypothetical protein
MVQWSCDRRGSTVGLMSQVSFPRVTACALALLSASSAVHSQTSSSAGAPPPGATQPPQNTQIARSSASPAAQLGVYVFPAKSQSGEQQQLDQLHCYDWAKNQTHLDPLASATSPTVAANSPPPASAPPPVHTAARGAAGGAAFGAIAGNAGAGAAIGGTLGAIRGSRQQQAAQEQQAAHQQAAADAQQQANQQAAAQRDQFNKAFGACLDGKGYTVK